MDQLINLVAQRTGLPADKARTAVDTVLSYLKDRLPAPVAGQLDQLVAGGGKSGSSEGLGGIAKDIGGMFSK